MDAHLNTLFQFYHRQWWGYRELYSHFKCCRAFFNALALLIVGLGIVLGPVLKDPLAGACVTALGVMVKGWIDYKKFDFKLHLAHFAYTSYEKILHELRHYAQGMPLDDLTRFLAKVQTTESIITDLTPLIPHRYFHGYRKEYKTVTIHDQTMYSPWDAPDCKDTGDGNIGQDEKPPIAGAANTGEASPESC